jgi:hypothetical protein
MANSPNEEKPRRSPYRPKRRKLLSGKKNFKAISRRPRNLTLSQTVIGYGAVGSETVCEPMSRQVPGTNSRSVSPRDAENDMRSFGSKPRTSPNTSSADLPNADHFAHVGESMYQEIKSELKGLGDDGYVVIHIASHEYVSGNTREEATKLYAQRFGTDPGYVRRIGGFRYVGNIDF